MGMRSYDPIPRGEKGEPWDHLPVPVSKSEVGWLASHPLGIICHQDRQTIGCRSYLTDGHLPCWRCQPEAAMPKKWAGYVAVIDKNLMARFVIIGETMRDGVLALPPYAMIRISKGKNPKDPIVVAADNWRTLPIPPSAQRPWPVDLTETVLRLWRDPELAAWIHANPAPAAPAPAAPAPAPAEKPKARRKTKAEERATAAYPIPLPPDPAGEPAALDSVMSSLMKKAANLKPSANGDGGSH